MGTDVGVFTAVVGVLGGVGVVVAAACWHAVIIIKPGTMSKSHLIFIPSPLPIILGSIMDQIRVACHYSNRDNPHLF
jgi:hypothetical protein